MEMEFAMLVSATVTATIQGMIVRWSALNVITTMLKEGAAFRSVPRAISKTPKIEPVTAVVNVSTHRTMLLTAEVAPTSRSADCGANSVRVKHIVFAVRLRSTSERETTKRFAC